MCADGRSYSFMQCGIYRQCDNKWSNELTSMKICYTIPIKSIYYTWLLFFSYNKKITRYINMYYVYRIYIVECKFVLKNVRMTQETITAGNWAKNSAFNYTNIHENYVCVLLWWSYEYLLRLFLIVIDNVCQQRVCMLALLMYIQHIFFCSRSCKWVGRCGDRLYLPIWIYILWQSENEQWKKINK